MVRLLHLLRGAVMEIVKTLLRQVLMVALVYGASRFAWRALIRAWGVRVRAIRRELADLERETRAELRRERPGTSR